MTHNPTFLQKWEKGKPRREGPEPTARLVSICQKAYTTSKQLVPKPI